jgi:hypothetical protein
MTTTINAAHLQPWASSYAGLLGENWGGAVSYLQQRADLIRASLPLDTPFAITSNGGLGFATTNNPVTLAGTAPLTVQAIAINGVTYPITWTSLTNWTLQVPLRPYIYTNLLQAQGFDNYNGLLATAVASITVTNLVFLTTKPVVINEWMANSGAPGGFPDPADGRVQDWFELYNPNNFPVDLSGYYLTDAPTAPAKWQIPLNTIVPSCGFLLVWADNETSQNGSGANGDLHANFQLSHWGGTIALYAPDLTPQHTVVFGSQLQNVSQGLYPDGNTNSVYFMADWTPRASNRLGSPAPPQIAGLIGQTNGGVRFQASVIPGRTYRMEFKDNLSAPAWTQLGANLTAARPTLTFQDNLPGQLRRFYRLVLLE